MPTPAPFFQSSRTFQFDRVPAPKIARSSFQKNSQHKTTFNSGLLIPLYLDEILPGDTVSMQAQFFGRMQTLDFPILDNVYLDTFWFFCPNRLLWVNWAKFLGAQTDPGDSIEFVIPEVGEDEVGGGWIVDVGDLADYFGLPIGENLHGRNISALPFRMMNLIFNEWFRDENLQDSVDVPTGNGPDPQQTFAVYRRGKRHDYLTSCLPWPQKGDAVSLPIGSEAPVIGDGTTISLFDGAFGWGMYTKVDDPHLFLDAAAYGDPVGSSAAGFADEPSQLKTVGLVTDPTKSGMIADLSSAVAATIGEMREAIALQQILERDARMGTRYTERIFGMFGVSVPDFTAQRPEYLGGSIDRVTFLQVPQMTASPGSPTMADAKGALAAYAQLQARSGFTRSFVEHGYIMCLGAVRADITYQQRIDRMWTRETRFDFFDPFTAHLGEQAVLNKEVWFDTSGTPDAVFGYQERWSEMRSKLSQVTGKFRSDAAGTLDAWHLALDFAAQPVLNSTFIQDNPPISRVVAVTTEPEILLDSFFRCRHVRPMPVRSVPGLERL